ncbi:UNVERIFIED_CONTAM: hypothetical protein ABIE34_001533 [Jeotgalibacillus campisalis]
MVLPLVRWVALLRPSVGLPVAMVCRSGSITLAELVRRRVSARSYMMPVGTSSAQASAGATRTTPPAYIISCL